MTFTLSNGERFTGDMPRNPFDVGSGPIVLTPRDVLRDLPIATDWNTVGDAVRIPTQSGQGFRFDVGHRSDLIPATIPK